MFLLWLKGNRAVQANVLWKGIYKKESQLVAVPTITSDTYSVLLPIILSWIETQAGRLQWRKAELPVEAGEKQSFLVPFPSF